MDLLNVCPTSDPRAFRLVGELDLSSVQFLPSVDKVIGDLRLDLADLRFIDGAGLESLSGLARKLSGNLVVENPRLPIEKLIRKKAIRDGLSNLVISYRSAIDGSLSDPAGSWNPSGALVTEQTPESLCRSLVARAAHALGTPFFVSVSLAQGDRLEVAAFNHPLAGELDHLQIASDQGPTRQAVREKGMVGSVSLIEERRWAEFTNRALYSGVASVAAIPLTVGEQVTGALTMYGQAERAFTPPKIESVETLAGQASVAIANSSSYWSAKELIRQLQEALESRAVIDQAKGVLMAQDGVSADEAFRLLRKASQRGNLKVRDLARKVIDNCSGSAAKRTSEQGVNVLPNLPD